MMKSSNEIRDPIHVFVHLSSGERKILDSRPLQRLRHIHQLGLTSHVYPGATHRRFEHSLGVMELATRVLDVVTGDRTGEFWSAFTEVSDDRLRGYWRCALRLAALTHDLGHLPFSHTSEDLLPEGWTHEDLTAAIIRSDEMQSLFETIKIHPEDVVKLALGPEKLPNLEFSTWETILSEIIVGDAFGVDRMDYLLRDSHHAGVAYGRFDHYRLIDTLRILPVRSSEEKVTHERFALGVEHGGIQSAEALMLARHFMYSQVYLHPVRKSYDFHLQDFLRSWLPGGVYPTDVDSHLRVTDNEVMFALRKADSDPSAPGHDPASRIERHLHFKRIYERNPRDAQVNLEAGMAVFEALGQEFGMDRFRHSRFLQRGAAPDFPVRLKDGQIASSLEISQVLQKLPTINIDDVFADREIAIKAEDWIKANRDRIIQPKREDDGEA